MIQTRQITVLEHVDDHGVVHTQVFYREDGDIISRYEFERRAAAIHKMINLLIRRDRK